MKQSGFLFIGVVLVLLVHLVTVARGQSWLDFAHPDNPHVYFTDPDVPIKVYKIFENPTGPPVPLPVLVVLLRYSDHSLQDLLQDGFTPAYFEDMVFGVQRANGRPSVFETYRENSNGRVLIVPAIAGDNDGTADGIVGWVTAQTGCCLPNGTFEDDLSIRECQYQGGTSGCFGYYNQPSPPDHKDLYLEKKRAEGILRADSSFDFSQFDTKLPQNNVITSDELVVIVIDSNRAYGGNARNTDPRTVKVEGERYGVYQLVTGVTAATNNGLISHEIGHQAFGMHDLYEMNCSPVTRTVDDGYLCYSCGGGSGECNDPCNRAEPVQVPSSTQGTTSNASGDSAPFCDTSNTAAGRWYSVIGTGNTITATTCDPGSSFDTKITLYCNGCSGLACVAGNDDDTNCSGNHSTVSWCSEMYVEYLILVHGFNAENGNFVLNLSEDSVACSGAVACKYAAAVSDSWASPKIVRASLMGQQFGTVMNTIDPWHKIHLGFAKPLVVTHDGTYTLYDVETERSFTTQGQQPEAIIIYDPLRVDSCEEYFILENRTADIRDAQTGLPVIDRGMFIWLINENKRDPRRGLVRLVKRGGHNAHEVEAAWDGSNPAEGYDLTTTSTPRNTKWNDGSPSYIEITDISPAGSQMTFEVRMPPIFVDVSNAGVETGSQANPFNTVLEGLDAIPQPPRTIKIAGGSYSETMLIDTTCTLTGWRNGNALIGQ